VTLPPKVSASATAPAARTNDSTPRGAAVLRHGGGVGKRTLS